MINIELIFDLALLFLPLLLTSIGVIIILYGAHKFIIVRHSGLGNERLLPRQLIMLGLTFASVVAITIALPVSEGIRNQMLVLIGIVTSGIFAFSSTTIFANLMAGIMLRVTKPFITGDFISVNDYFGRVVDRGLLDTEIQTEDKRLVALPNTLIISAPVSVVRNSGTIVSVTLSLGYDLHYTKVESLLLEATRQAGLQEPFVQILELGNYAITYKTSGILTDVKVLLTAHSNLRRYILDMLHNNGIEIVSPAFMNQRKIAEDSRVIPKFVNQKPPKDSAVVEEIVFDKAEEAEKIEKEKRKHIETIESCEKDLEGASALEKKQLKAIIKSSRERLKVFDTPIEENND